MYKMILFVSMIFVAESAAYIAGYPTVVYRRSGESAPEVPVQRGNVVKSSDSTDPEARLGYVYTAFSRRAGDSAPHSDVANSGDSTEPEARLAYVYAYARRAEDSASHGDVAKSGDSADPEARLGYVYSSVFSRRAEDSDSEVPIKRGNVIKSGDSTDPEARLGYVYSSLYSRRAEDSAAQVPVHHADVNSGDSTDPEARIDVVVVPRGGFSSYSSSRFVH